MLVLSRVTLGADVAVTSVLLAAAKQAWANAEIVFVGPRKNFELFAADVVGNSFLLAWIYGGTGSILVCVLFHAAGNTSATLGLDAWDGSPQMAWIGPAVKIALGATLILLLPLFKQAKPPA